MAQELLARLEGYNQNILSTITRLNKDYMRLFCGWEGEGKTMFAVRDALKFNPDFNPETQAVYTIEQFKQFQRVYKGHKGKICFMDEAVLCLLGDDAQTREAKWFKKVFYTIRSRGHIYFLCSPSPFAMMPSIRKWRVRDCLLLYTDPYKTKFERRFAYYSKRSYQSWIIQKKAADQIMIPDEFIKIHKPDMNGIFKDVTDKQVLDIYKYMDEKKSVAQDSLIDEPVDSSPTDQRTLRNISGICCPIIDRLHDEEGYTYERASELANFAKRGYFAWKKKNEECMHKV